MSLKTKLLCFMLVFQVPPFSGFGPEKRVDMVKFDPPRTKTKLNRTFETYL